MLGPDAPSQEHRNFLNTRKLRTRDSRYAEIASWYEGSVKSFGRGRAESVSSEDDSGGSNDIVTIPSGNQNLLGSFTYGNIPGVTSFNATTSIAGYDLESMEDVQHLAWPNLVSIDPDNTQGGFLSSFDNPILIDFSAPVLETVGGEIRIRGTNHMLSASLPSLVDVGGALTFFNLGILNSISCPVLETIGNNLYLQTLPALLSFSLPVLTAATGGMSIYENDNLASVTMNAMVTAGSGVMNIKENILLTSVSLTSFLPENGLAMDFTENALLAASVNHILARCIAKPCFCCGSGGFERGDKRGSDRSRHHRLSRIESSRSLRHNQLKT